MHVNNRQKLPAPATLVFSTLHSSGLPSTIAARGECLLGSESYKFWRPYSIFQNEVDSIF